jgi:hypothetical protein
LKQDKKGVLDRWGLQNKLDVHDPENHGKYQDRIARMYEEGENGMLFAFFWRLFFPSVIFFFPHIILWVETWSFNKTS